MRENHIKLRVRRTTPEKYQIAFEEIVISEDIFGFDRHEDPISRCAGRASRVIQEARWLRGRCSSK